MRGVIERVNNARSNSFSEKLPADHVLLGCVNLVWAGKKCVAKQRHYHALRAKILDINLLIASTPYRVSPYSVLSDSNLTAKGSQNTLSGNHFVR